jgi:hypothetical protein
MLAVAAQIVTWETDLRDEWDGTLLGGFFTLLPDGSARCVTLRKVGSVQCAK